MVHVQPNRCFQSDRCSRCIIHCSYIAVHTVLITLRILCGSRGMHVLWNHTIFKSVNLLNGVVKASTLLQEDLKLVSYYFEQLGPT